MLFHAGDELSRETSPVVEVEHDTLTINMDGSSFGNLGRVGFGGLIHDEYGGWVTSFFGYINITTSTHAELVAILQGLLTVADMGEMAFVLEINSLEAVNLIKDGDSSTHEFSVIIRTFDITLLGNL